MSVNSDEVAEGIIKAVGYLVTIGIAGYVAYKEPWLLWLLIPAAVLYGIVRVIADELTAPYSAIHKVGSVLGMIGFVGFAGGMTAYWFGYRDELTSYVTGGCFVAMMIGGAISEISKRQSGLKK